MQAKRRALTLRRSKNGVASLAYGRSKNGVASLACGRSKNGVASLVYAGLVAGLAAAVCLSGVATAKADPLDIFWSDPLSVPPFKGNDTGGIIAWQYAQQIDARKLAADHCASYGKLARRLATQPYYGGYISFKCYWPRGLQVVRVY